MIYLYSQLQNDVNSRIKGKIGILRDPRSKLNEGVRQVYAEIDFIPSRRKIRLTPNLFSGVFEYASPTDLKGYSIISILNQTFEKSRDWNLVPFEQFLRRQDQNTIAISDYDGIKKILLNTTIDDAKITINNFDSTDGVSTIGDGTNISVDRDNFITRNASLNFDISSAGGVTAGISGICSPIDMTEYIKGNGTVTVWHFIKSITGITNYILKIGSDSSNYYQKTITTQADGTAFVEGWNLFKFDLTSLTTNGTPVITSCDYFELYMTKDGTKISETGYKFDDLVIHRGEINYIYYYSGFGWQTSTGTYINNSTSDTDYLNAGEEEYELILAKCSELAADDVDEEKVSIKQEKRYEQLKKVYESNNPSEALIMISTVQDFVKV